jgi:spore photoproduct lyase
MSNSEPYAEKFSSVSEHTSFHCLPVAQQAFTRETAALHRFTLQELHQFTQIALDLNRWGESNIIEIWPKLDAGHMRGREQKKALLLQLNNRWMELKTEPNRYHMQTPKPTLSRPNVISIPKDSIGLGYCPVASEKTRCCNLITLDAVENCGFDCSYCSIQSFYHNNQVIFDSNFDKNLSGLRLDPDKIYHIGTGQSSDSLMWGNNYKMLDTLIRFAESNPNVILEFKTKSANITHLNKIDIPSNILCTWSLNTQEIIQNEEHGTAALKNRMLAARKIADKGALVGFHFHPIVHYQNWRKEYFQLYQQVQQLFEPAEVAMISLGTLTFIKPVVKKIRERNFHSKILKMPLVETAGKLSYPPETKLELFTHAYSSFSQQWRDEVFFYLCMEEPAIWQPVFGYQYRSNDEFELAMKSSYMQKIRKIA